MKKIISLAVLSFSISLTGMEPPLKAPQEALNRELVQAVQKNEAAKVRSLLAQGADPNTRYGKQNTVLELAVFRSNLPIVTDLLQAGADPSETPTILCDAMKDTRSTVVDILIQHPKTNINCMGKINLGRVELSPLMDAARTNNYTLADKLYQTGRL